MRKEKGEREGEKTWVFHPRIIMAEAWSRTRRQSALSERFLGMIVFKNINIFREIALSEQQDEISANSFNKPALSEQTSGALIKSI